MQEGEACEERVAPVSTGSARLRIALKGEAQRFTIQMSGTGRFRDIVLSRHGKFSAVPSPTTNIGTPRW